MQWAYAGSDGGNFYNELRLKEMDFGTFHAYPDWWSKTADWTNRKLVLVKKAPQFGCKELLPILIEAVAIEIASYDIWFRLSQ
jgi:hypothetical protein